MIMQRRVYKEMIMQSRVYKVMMPVTLLTLTYIYLYHDDLNLMKSKPGRDVTHEEQTKLDKWQKQLCIWRKTPMDVQHKAELIFDIPVIGRDIFPEQSPMNVFLVDTSCNPQPPFRELCSVESWARLNPTKPIWYIVTSPFINDKSGLLRELRARYKNLNVVGCDMSMVMSKTPLKDVFESNKWFDGSPWPPVNLSDMVRYLLVWMFGGIYSDTDVICIKDTKPLSNVVGVANDPIIGSAVFHGEPNHTVFWKLMEHVSKHFKGSAWGTNGPRAVTQVVREHCNLLPVEKKFDHLPISCKNGHMKILPHYSFFPLPFQRYREFFSSKKRDLSKDHK